MATRSRGIVWSRDLAEYTSTLTRREVIQAMSEDDAVLWVGDRPLLFLDDMILAYRLKGEKWQLH